MLKGYFLYKDIDFMMIGAHPDWKGKGLSSIYHYHTNKTILRKNCVGPLRILSWKTTRPWKSGKSTIKNYTHADVAILKPYHKIYKNDNSRNSVAGSGKDSERKDYFGR